MLFFSAYISLITYSSSWWDLKHNMAEWNSLSSFPSLPFLVFSLCLSGSLSLLETRVDGDWMLSQIQRTPRGQACHLSQTHSTCKGGFVSLPLTCLKYRCLYCATCLKLPSESVGRNRHVWRVIHLILGRLVPKIGQMNHAFKVPHSADHKESLDD